MTSHAFGTFPMWGSGAFGLNDPLHRVSRDMAEAGMSPDMWSMIIDTTAVLNYDHGPYLSSCNFQRSLELAERSVVADTCDGDVFQCVLPGICEDDGEDWCPDFGTAEHCKRAFDRLPFADCFKAMVGKVKWVRWGSHHYLAGTLC